MLSFKIQYRLADVVWHILPKPWSSLGLKFEFLETLSQCIKLLEEEDARRIVSLVRTYLPIGIVGYSAYAIGVNPCLNFLIFLFDCRSLNVNIVPQSF